MYTHNYFNVSDLLLYMWLLNSSIIFCYTKLNNISLKLLRCSCQMEELAYSLEMTSGRGVGCELTDKRLCSSFLLIMAAATPSMTPVTHSPLNAMGTASTTAPKTRQLMHNDPD